jgi:hypothetical protein
MAGSTPRRPTQVRRGLRRLLLVALVGGTAAGGALALASAPPPAAATSLDLLSDRSYKMTLLERLPYRPRLYFFGGSRSMRFEPAYMRSRWGIRAFNATVQSCKHEDVWAIAHRVVRLYPTRKKYVVWGIQPEAFFTNQVFDIALVKDPRLRPYFSLTLRRAMGEGLRHAWYPGRAYAADGGLVYDYYDRMQAEGYTLSAALDSYIKKVLSWSVTADGIPRTVTRTRTYFESTLTYMNRQGIEPLLIIMPMHPRVIRAIRDVHWDNRRAAFAAYLAGLQETRRFTVLDFTFISSFDGDPAAFYNATHMKKSNMRRLIRAAVRTAPWAFGLAPSPYPLAASDGRLAVRRR